MTETSPPATDVAVSFVFNRLRAADRWRFVLRRVHPRAVDPLRLALLRWLFIMGYLAVVAVFVGMVMGAAASPGLVAAPWALVAPVQIWRIKRVLLRGMGPTETYTVALGPAGALVGTATRVMFLRWVGATGVLVTRHEVVIRYRTVGVVSVPTSVFADDAALGRFVTLARSSVAAAAEGRDQGRAP